MDNRMKSCVVAAGEGDAFWQPGVKGNCITIKVSPWNIEKTQHTIFLHELPKGGMVRKLHLKNMMWLFWCY